MVSARFQDYARKKYAEREVFLAPLREELEIGFSGCTGDEAVCMKFLYGTMPLRDAGEYAFSTFLGFVRHALWLRENVEWCKSLPEDIFADYVLSYRINNEDITDCRAFFYSQLRDRIVGLEPEEAVKEINYWCAENAAYQASDMRTASPMTVYRSGKGRCGEESTFAVTALRSAGIPARQVYTPRWAHCDDNHAWVEIWSDGQWYFIGGGEPEQILNKGWFTNASSRAMMVHSRVFDTMIPEGEVIGKDGMVTMLNELKRYARTKEITVSVKDSHGKPAEGAEVSFEVLNYSEYAPIAELKTDSLGKVSLTTGLGSIHISARMYADGEWLHAENSMDTKTEDCCEICLMPVGKEKGIFYEEWTEIDMIAPHDAPVNKDMPTSEQKERGSRRLAEANAYREQKVRNLSNLECRKFLEKETGDSSMRKKLLEVLTEKDRTDCISQVLEEHLKSALPYEKNMDADIFVPYVLNPRVDDEVLQKYRKTILEQLSEEEKNMLQKEPAKIWKWIEDKIVSSPEKERSSVITTPSGCLKTGTGSLLSKKILFVAMARTLGIPARLNPHDRSMEYMKNGKFIPVSAETEKKASILLKASADTQWKYFQNWSIAKLEAGKYITRKLEAENFRDQVMKLPLEAGNYRILTSNRLPNGNIFAAEYYFEVQIGEMKRVELAFRNANLEDMLENISIPEFTLRKEDGSTVKASELTADGKHILAFLEEEKEPTEHILNEMMEQEEAFSRYANRIIFVVKSKKALETPTLSRALGKLGDVQILYDDFSEIINTLGRRMYVDPDKLPLIIVTNGSLNGIYATSGYNVGTGDMLLRLL